MKKSVTILKIILPAIAGALVTLLIIQGWDWFPKGSRFDLQTLGVWVASVATGVGLILVAIITRKQTDRQIENQNKQIDIQIENQNKQIDRQIENQNKQIDWQIKNQNKQMHRPYLHIWEIEKNCNDKTLEKNKMEINSNTWDRLKNGESIECNDRGEHTVHLAIKNCGNGIATKIRFFNYYPEIKTNDNTPENEYNTICYRSAKPFPFRAIEKGKEEEFPLVINYSLKDAQSSIMYGYDAAIILLFYSDINNNIYYSMIRVTLEKEKKEQNISAYFRYFSNEHPKFKEMLEYSSYDEKELLKEYKDTF